MYLTNSNHCSAI